MLSPRLAALAVALLSPVAVASERAPAAVAAEARSMAVITLDGLLARFRSIPGLSARFREEKRIALLAEPIVSEGTVHYAPPRRLARHVRLPSASHLVLDGTALKFGDGAGTQQIDVGASAVVRALVESFLDVLAGDRPALERAFVIEFHPGDSSKHPTRWSLRLTPRLPALLGILKEMRFEGDGIVVSKLHISEASGDEGVTTFSEVDTAHRFSPEEATRVFRVDP